MNEEEYIGKETTIDFGGDLRMSRPWRSYPSDEVFTIVKKTKSGLFLLRDSKGNEHPLKKSSINYFKKKTLTDSEKTNFIVETESRILAAIMKGHKANDSDEFSEDRKLMNQYRKELGFTK